MACTYTWPSKMFVYVVPDCVIRLVGEGKGPITFYSRLSYPYGNTRDEIVWTVWLCKKIEIIWISKIFYKSFVNSKNLNCS